MSSEEPPAGPAVLRLPMLLLSVADMLKAMAILRPYLDHDYAQKGILVLGQYTYPFQVIWGRKKITSLDDIKGLKLRVTSVEEGEFNNAYVECAGRLGVGTGPGEEGVAVFDGGRSENSDGEGAMNERYWSST